MRVAVPGLGEGWRPVRGRPGGRQLAGERLRPGAGTNSARSAARDVRADVEVVEAARWLRAMAARPDRGRAGTGPLTWLALLRDNPVRSS